MVAAQAHQKGSMKSASSPSNMKTIQNIFFCIVAILIDWQTEPQSLHKLDAESVWHAGVVSDEPTHWRD